MKISLEAARKNAGLTQKQAADKIGISPNTLRNYETGTTSPPLKRIEKICKVYKCRMSNIFF